MARALLKYTPMNSLNENCLHNRLKHAMETFFQKRRKLRYRQPFGILIFVAVSLGTVVSGSAHAQETHGTPGPESHAYQNILLTQPDKKIQQLAHMVYRAAVMRNTGIVLTSVGTGGMLLATIGLLLSDDRSESARGEEDSLDSGMGDLGNAMGRTLAFAIAMGITGSITVLGVSLWITGGVRKKRRQQKLDEEICANQPKISFLGVSPFITANRGFGTGIGISF